MPAPKLVVLALVRKVSLLAYFKDRLLIVQRHDSRTGHHLHIALGFQQVNDAAEIGELHVNAEGLANTIDLRTQLPEARD